MTLEIWKNSTLKKFIEKNTVSQDEVDKVVDFLTKNSDIKLNRLSYPQAREKAKMWEIKITTKLKNSKESGSVDIIASLDKGFTLVRLKDQIAKSWEGKHMRHCVGGDDYQDSQCIYSLRDKNHIPHCTLEVNGRWIGQLKGRGNKEISQKYVKHILFFLKSWNLCLSNEEDAQRLGYESLSSEEIKFRRDSFVDTHEFISDFITYGPIDVNKLKIKSDSYLLTFSRLHASYGMCRNRNYSFKRLYEFFLRKNDTVGQLNVINLNGQLSKGFIDEMLMKAIDRGFIESIIVLINQLPEGSDLSSYIHHAARRLKFKIVDHVINLIKTDTEKENIFYQVLNCAVSEQDSSLLDWVLSKHPVKISSHHLRDCIRRRQSVDVGEIDFFRKIVSLYEPKDGIDFRTFSYAAQASSTFFLETLIEKGIMCYDEKEKETILNNVLSRSLFTNTKLLLKHGFVITFNLDCYLPGAARIGDIELVKFLLDQGATVSGGDFKALYEASKQGFDEIKSILLEVLRKEQFSQ